ncbi:regulator of chromosome condensation 1/beta-lactamase-inhibitor protein II [Trichoderma austrokoningii]
MDLFATGFNAWHQLSINRHVSQDAQASKEEEEEEPHDLLRFTKVLSASTIQRPVSRLTYTIVHRDGDLLVAGLVPPSTLEETEAEFLYTSAEAASGQLLAIVHDKHGDDSNKLLKYSSLASRRAGAEPESIFTCRPPATQVAAFNTGFVILHSDGTVSTFGDSRFEACLGRDTDTLDRPSDKPGPVPDLNDIASADDPIKLVTAGGTAVAALTSTSHGVYVWGSSPPWAASRHSQTPHRRGHAFPELSGVPNYTEIDGGKDVVDVALGEAHAIALTLDGLIYVIGENANGQLGLGKEVERAETWTSVPFLAADGYKIVGVAAGPRASFVLTAKS